MSHQKASKASLSATFSVALEDGQGLCRLQDGIQIDLFGQEVPLVSLSQPQEIKKAKTTSGIFGLSSSISSESANLQQSLESRLRQQLDLDGLMIYKATWKQKVTPQRRSYCHLAVSAHRTKEIDSSSPPSAWATPVAQPANGSWEQFLERKRKSVEGGHSMGISLSDTQMQAKSIDVSSWPTPRAGDGNKNSRTSEGAERELVRRNMKPEDLNQAIRLATAPWATPNTLDHMALRSDEAPLKQATTVRKGRTFPNNLREQVDPRSQEIYASGKIPPPSIAETENTVPSQLNPRFSLWLMGYPIEWAYCAERVTQSSRKQQRKS